jgi:hypothetical protein
VRTPSRGARAAVLVLALLACNDGLHPVPAPTTCPQGFTGICGHVTFQGTLPDSTQAVYVVAYHTFPQSRDSLFTFQPSLILLQKLPLDSTIAFYTVPLSSGRYEWVVAVWVKQGFTLANADSTLREAGYYRDPADTTLPGVVNVYTQGTDSIDFVIDFDHMNPPCRYYSPPCP